MSMYKKPSDFARMAALIAAIAAAKVLMPVALTGEEAQHASPLVPQAAPIYVKSLREDVPAAWWPLRVEDFDV